MTTTLCWFTPQADPPRRAFFERVPECNLRWIVAQDALHTVLFSADLCRAAVDRWARAYLGGYQDGIAEQVCVIAEDCEACRDAHRLADALGVAP